jgi:hypothetical protein
MSTTQRRFTKSVGIGAAILVLTGAAAHQAIPHGHRHGGADRPADSEFGLGPRASVGGLYRATLEPQHPLQVGKMQSVRVVLTDSTGQPVSGAQVTVDGGMPEHGHGLPTSPVAAAFPEAGVYEIQGVKFNMGGWWVFNLHVDGAAGRDSVTFNLSL